MDECVRLTCNIPNRLANTVTNLLTALNINYSFLYDDDVVNAKNNTFIAPTEEEVNTFCQKNNYIINVPRFVEYYQKLGWKEKGGTTHIDWKNKIKSWSRNGLDSKLVQAQQNKTTYYQSASTVADGVAKTEEAFKKFGI